MSNSPLDFSGQLIDRPCRLQQVLPAAQPSQSVSNQGVINPIAFTAWESPHLEDPLQLWSLSQPVLLTVDPNPPARPPISFDTHSNILNLPDFFPSIRPQERHGSYCRPCQAVHPSLVAFEPFDLPDLRGDLPSDQGVHGKPPHVMFEQIQVVDGRLAEVITEVWQSAFHPSTTFIDVVTLMRHLRVAFTHGLQERQSIIASSAWRFRQWQALGSRDHGVTFNEDLFTCPLLMIDPEAAAQSRLDSLSIVRSESQPPL